MNDVLSGAWQGFIISSTFTPLLLLLLKKLFPPQRFPIETVRTFEELKKKYQKWEFGSAFLFFGIAIPVTYYLWKILSWYGNQRFEALEESSYSLVPVPFLWLLPAFLPSMIIGMILGGRIFQILLRDQQSEFSMYQRLKYEHAFSQGGMPQWIRKVYNNSDGWEFPFSGLLCLISAICVWLMLNWYILFTPNQIVINPLFGLSEVRYDYQDIDSIVASPRLKAPIGNVVDRWEFVLHFRDGVKWSSNMNPAEAREELKKDIACFVSQKSGAPIQEIPLFERGQI